LARISGHVSAAGTVLKPTNLRRLTVRQHRCGEISGSPLARGGHMMWTINSNDVQQAKQELERRRTEMDRKYAEEKATLDAEFAVVETLERAASEFSVRHTREDDPNSVAAPPALIAPSSGEPADRSEDVAAATAFPTETDQPTSDETSGAFDILKPGSRWRLNRGNRPSNPEGPTGSPSPTTW
jgi:hypothetical protein